MKAYRWGHSAVVLAVGLFLAACGGKDEITVEPEPTPPPGPVEPVESDEQLLLQLSAGALDGAQWDVPESVRFYPSKGDGYMLRLNAGVYSNDNVWVSWAKNDCAVLSPAQESSFNGESLEVRFPDELTAVSGAVPDSLCFGLGYGKGTELLMEPLFSGLKLRLARDDVYGIILRANGGESLSGRARVMVADAGMEMLDLRPAIRYSASIGVMDKAQEWLVVLPPAVLSRGLTVTVEALAGEYEFRTDALTLARGKILPLEIPDGLQTETDHIDIPDANFKAWLVERFDTDGDKEISKAEAQAVTSIELQTHEIHSLEGIRKFKNLETLIANGSRAEDRTILGQLTELDLSGLSKLTSVQCRHNHITSLTLHGNTALKTLICYGNSLTALDLSGAPMLETVDAGDCAIAAAHVRENTFLGKLSIHNNRLTALDLSGNPYLQSLTCDRNLITELDLSACTALTSVRCAPMNDDGGQNVLLKLTLAYGMSIPGITENRSTDYIPAATEIVWVGAPQQTTLGTGLRTMYITTPDGSSITSKTTWKENCTVKLVDDDGKIYYENTTVAVKGRGNSTWGYPKKPYTLKLPEKFDFLGTGEDKRWVLLANWMDRTLLRNDVAFELGRRSSLEWTPSGEFIELFLNGQHMGNYWLGEKIKTGNQRLKADFLFEMDTYYDAQWKFYSSYGFRPNSNATGLPIGVKEPDDDKMTEALLGELKALVSGVENAIYNKTADYRTKMNVQSFIDWYLVHELTYNGEPNHPKSCYFYFRDGVMYAGPLWDFDWYTFQPSVSGLFIPNSIYFKELFKDANFKAALKARWAELKPAWSTIPDYIDARAAEIRKSEAINWSMWPCSSSYVNGDERMTFDVAITRMKNAFSARIKTLDTAINNL